MYDNIDDAMSALHNAEIDVANDHGEEMVEAAFGEIVNNIASICTPDVARELRRRTLGEV